MIQHSTIVVIFISFFNICPEFTSAKVLNGNLDELKNFCYPKEYDRPDVVYVHLAFSQMSNFFNKSSSRGIERLHISVEPTGEDRKCLIDVNNIHQLQNLTELWIIWDSQKEMKRMAFQYEGSAQLPNIRRLHLHFWYNIDNGDLMRFIQSVTHLELLDIVGFKAVEDMGKSIIKALQNKPIKALKLNKLGTLISQEFFHIDPHAFFSPISNASLICLDLSNNYIMSFDVGVTSVFPSLRIINVSKNLLNSKKRNAYALLELVINPILQLINVSYQGLASDESKPFSKRSTHHNDNNGLRMSKNCDEYFFPAITTGNRDSVCKLANCTLENFPCEIIPFHFDIGRHLDFACTPQIKFPMGQNLQELLVDNIGATTNQVLMPITPGTICIEPNNLKRLSFSRNSEYLHFRNTEIAIKKSICRGLESLSYIDFSFNSINMTLPCRLLTGLPSLQEINLRRNGVILTLNNLTICDIWRSLKYLDISLTNIHRIPSGFFRNCKGLSLNIAHNNISDADLETDFPNMLQIKAFNVSFNNIHYFTGKVRHLMKNIKNHQPAMDFRGNPFTCDCSEDSIETIKLLQESVKQGRFLGVEHYLCYQTYFSTGYQFISQINLEEVENLCFPKKPPLLLIILATLSSIVAICSSLALFWKYRFYAFTFYYRQKFKVTKPTQSEFKYDVFISYCSEDRIWVHNVLMKTLEEKYNFKLCIHYRYVNRWT